MKLVVKSKCGIDPACFCKDKVFVAAAKKCFDVGCNAQQKKAAASSGAASTCKTHLALAVMRMALEARGFEGDLGPGEELGKRQWDGQGPEEISWGPPPQEIDTEDAQIQRFPGATPEVDDSSVYKNDPWANDGLYKRQFDDGNGGQGPEEITWGPPPQEIDTED